MTVPEERRKELQEVLEACRAVEERRMNPFLLDVSHALGVASGHFPTWTTLEDLYLDARVLNAISRVLQLQEARLRYEAGLFFSDPDALAEKVRRLPLRELSGILLGAWHPAVELEQVSEGLLERAKAYWDAIEPRVEEEVEPLVEAAEVDEEQMAALGILSKEGFLKHLGELWEELKQVEACGYWSFVKRGGFQKLVRRAYGVSFLVSYGYADLLQEDGEWTLRAHEERVSREESVSVPLAIPTEVVDG